MTLFAQIIHVPNGPSPIDVLDSAEQRVTRFFLHANGTTVRVSVHVYSPPDMSRDEPIVVDIEPGSGLLPAMVNSKINYRLRTVVLHDTLLVGGATEYALFRGTRVSSEPFASVATNVVDQDTKIRPMLYAMFDMAIKAARPMARASDLAKPTVVVPQDESLFAQSKDTFNVTGADAQAMCTIQKSHPVRIVGQRQS